MTAHVQRPVVPLSFKTRCLVLERAIPALRLRPPPSSKVGRSVTTNLRPQQMFPEIPYLSPENSGYPQAIDAGKAYRCRAGTSSDSASPYNG